MTARFDQIALLQRLLGLFTLLMMLMTAPLWTLPPTVANPQIPWFSCLVHIPVGVDRVCLVGIILASLSQIVLPSGTRWRNRSQGFYFATLAILVLFDQHRLQPWVLQFLFFGLILTCSSGRTAIVCCRWIVLSIYLYSAISKLDAAFFATHGQLLLEGFLQAIQIDTAYWSAETRERITLVFPLGEGLAAGLLVTARWRRWGVFAAGVMHVSILLAVGPFGLNHEPGVLLWNFYFLLQNVILFWPCEPQDAQTLEVAQKSTPATPLMITRLIYGMTAILALLPLLEIWDWYDHWPAWAVYSSRPEKVSFLLSQSACENFPERLKTYCGPSRFLETQRPFQLDRWSFEQRNCPLYPQLRYRLAVGRALLEEHVPEHEISVEIGLSPHRWTGQRETITLNGWTEIDTFLKQYLLNTKPRTY